MPTADQLIYGALTKMRKVDSKRVQMEVELVYDLDHPNERFNNFYLATENLSFKNLGKNKIQSSHDFIEFLEITADLIYPEPGEMNVLKFNVIATRKLRLVTYV